MAVIDIRTIRLRMGLPFLVDGYSVSLCLESASCNAIPFDGRSSGLPTYEDPLCGDRHIASLVAFGDALHNDGFLLVDSQ
jgi:hypothetical protein